MRETKDQAPGEGWSRAGRASPGNGEWTGSSLGALRLLPGPGTGSKEQPKVESERARVQLPDRRLSKACGGLGETQRRSKTKLSLAAVLNLPRYTAGCRAAGWSVLAILRLLSVLGVGRGDAGWGAVSVPLSPHLLTGLDQTNLLSSLFRFLPPASRGSHSWGPSQCARRWGKVDERGEWGGGGAGQGWYSVGAGSGFFSQCLGHLEPNGTLSSKGSVLQRLYFLPFGHLEAPRM